MIRRLQSRLRDDLGVSVAEVDHQDLWQRCTLGVAIACSDATTGRGVVQDVERIVARTVEVEVLDIHVEVVQAESDGFSLAGVGLHRGAPDPRIGVDGLVVDGMTIDVGVDPAGLEHLLTDEMHLPEVGQ